MSQRTGSELAFNCTKGQFKSRHDALVCAMHWQMVSDGLRCIGNGENVAAENVRPSEMLPDGWNDSDGLYTLLYQPTDSNETFLLKIVCNGDDLLTHLVRLRDDKVASANFLCRDYANEDISTFERAYKDLAGLQDRFKKEILDTIQRPAPSRERARQQPRPEDDDPLRVSSPRGNQPPRLPDWNSREDFSVGRGDLDPLAGGQGGGMIMDPSRGRWPGSGIYPSSGLPARLPRGAVPPGARFDPYGPPDFTAPGPSRGQRSGPDPDHLPPPGYDDMFM